MELDSDQVGDVLVVSVGGRVDWSGAQGFSLFLEDLVRRQGPGPIILDTADLNYIASGGIRAMLIAARAGAQIGAFRDLLARRQPPALAPRDNRPRQVLRATRNA